MMNGDSVENYILASEQNLRMAVAVSDSWLEARERLVSGFLDRLGEKVVAQPGGWEHARWGRFYVDKHSGFCFWKPAWKDQYQIGMLPLDRGEKVIFGVMRVEEEIKNRPFCDDLLEAVKALDPSARARSWWEAWMTMRSPAADWTMPEVLWRMHKDDAFLNEVAEQMLSVAKVSENILDRLVQQA